VVKKLLDSGVSLQNIRTAVGYLRDRGIEDIATVTLVSDGTTIYECLSRDEAADLLLGGQGVFAIAVGPSVLEVQGSLAELPGESPRSDAHTGDELAARRHRRGA